MESNTNTIPSIYPTPTRNLRTSGSVDQVAVLTTLKKQVQQIISRRRRTALISMIMGPFVAAGITFFTKDTPIVVSVSAILFVIMLVLFSGSSAIYYVINNNSYPEPKSSYRRWNKFLYNIGSRILIVFSILNIISNIRDIMNPFYSMKGPETPSKALLALDTLASGAIVVGAYNELKPAEKVEAYYAQLDIIAFQKEQAQ